jgi:hypothetical protein
MARRYDDDDDAFETINGVGVLRDGRSVTVPMMMRDAMRSDIAHHAALLDAPMFDARSRRPGFRFTTDATANDAVDAAYTSYEREMSQAWRGADASGQPEGAICTVREGGGRYGPEGAPGHMRRVDGDLRCVADDRRDDSRSDARRDGGHRDHRQTMDQIYNQIDAERSQEWRQR